MNRKQAEEELKKEFGIEEPKKDIELTKEIFNEVKKIISKYLEITEENLNIVCLWVIGTYFHSQFETFPLLQIEAQKRSGKTRLLKLLSSLSYKSDGSVSTSPTETLLFRNEGNALFFDEMENINSKERSAFRETLNACYKRGNKIIRYREVKKEYIKQEFFPYYPLALANIRGVGDVLADRSVNIVLIRNKGRKTKLIEDFKTNTDIIYLKEKLSRLKTTIPKNFNSKWNDYIQKKEIDKKLKTLFDKINETNIEGRSLEIFLPLFIISYLCDNIDEFILTAQKYVNSKEEEEGIDDIDERLKEFVQKRTQEEEYFSFVNSSKILSDFRLSFENPEEYINSKWLGRALKRLGLIEKKRLVNGRVQIKLNSTNSTNPIYTTNSTNSTNLVESVDKVEFVDSVGVVDKQQIEVQKIK